MTSSSRPHPSAGSSPSLRVLVAGATGYVGSRLIPELLAAGHTVLAGSRTRGRLDEFPWGGQVEHRALDIGDDDTVRAAMDGVDAVVYLVHSMDADDFVTKDREAAERVARAGGAAGVRRLVYLSGLIPDEPEDDLSDHLRSRLEVERVFLESTVPATVLRAAMVIGAGSTSYELLRRLSERVPLLTPVPGFLRHRLQPIAVEDVVHLITRALQGEPRDRHYDVGGDEVLTYPELLALYADVAGLRRARFSVPWVPRSVVGWACARISGLDATTVESLVDSLSHEMVCGEDDVRREIAEPGFRFTSTRESLARSQERDGDGTDVRGDVQAGADTDPH